MEEDHSLLSQFRERRKQLLAVSQEELVNKLAELEIDFEYIKELNKELSMKYHELMCTFPTVTELESLIQLVEQSAFGYDTVTTNSRLINLKKFKSAVYNLNKDR